MSRVFTVAFTGNSGAGKSLAAEYLGRKGIPSIDCDVLARKVVEVGSPCLDELITEFGKTILNEDGTLNRKELANIAFSDISKKQKLDSITHPYIIAEVEKELEVLRNAGTKICIIEAPALIESGFYKNVDMIVLIGSSRETLISRISKRDSISNYDAKKRIDSQVNDSETKTIADYTIDNDGTYDEYIEKLEKLRIELLKRIN